VSARPPIDALAWLYRDVAVGPLDGEAANADVLTYDTLLEKWKNAPSSGGGGGGGGGSNLIDAGLTHITARILNVVFATDPSDTGYSIEMSVENLVDDPADTIFPCTVINRSTSGFSVEFNATPPTTNYYLRWVISTTIGGGGSGTLLVLSTTALRAIPTTSTIVQTTLAQVLWQIGGAWTQTNWFLIAGTSADNEAGGVIRPNDYAAGTNEKIWVKVLGL
jgi:hypothetical protein